MGCQLYMVGQNQGREISVDIYTIKNIFFGPISETKSDVLYTCKGVYGALVFKGIEIKESNINKDGVVYDNRQNAYNQACNLLNENIEHQLDEIRKKEKV